MPQCKRSVSCLTQTPWITARQSVWDPNPPTSLPSLSRYSSNTNSPIPIESKRERGLEAPYRGHGESVLPGYRLQDRSIIPLAISKAPAKRSRLRQDPVSIKGRGPEGYYELSRTKVERPKDWSSLEKAFADKTPIAGVITAVVKAASAWTWSAARSCPPRQRRRDAAEMEKLIARRSLPHH